MKIKYFMLFFLASFSFAEQPVITLQTTITGNQEQPKVLSIVPWQQPMANSDEFFQPVSSLIEADMQFIDRDVMLRQLNYHKRLQQQQKQ